MHYARMVGVARLCRAAVACQGMANEFTVLPIVAVGMWLQIFLGHFAQVFEQFACRSGRLFAGALMLGLAY